MINTILDFKAISLLLVKRRYGIEFFLKCIFTIAVRPLEKYRGIAIARIALRSKITLLIVRYYIRRLVNK